MRGKALLPLLPVLCLALAAPIESPPGPKDYLPPTLSLTAIPLGLDKNRPVPPDNPLTQAKVQLGRRLFFDPILSADGKVSCAGCHQPEHGFASPSRFSQGVRAKMTSRNAPTLFNRAYGTSFFWDGREAGLEAQALRPIENPLEMGNTVAGVVKNLEKHPDYSAQFKAVFADGITPLNLARAISAFERVLLLGNSRVDRFRAGEVQALTSGERHGLWLYESRGRCWRCHSGPNFTDESFHNTGVSWGKAPVDLGRFEVTKAEPDRGKFKTPTLRGLTMTAPYMHDGSIATLEGVVEFYNQGGGKNPNLDPAMSELGLSKEEIEDLVAFLKALTDSSVTIQKK